MTRAAGTRKEILRIIEVQKGHHREGDETAVRMGDVILEDLRDELRYFIVGIRHGMSAAIARATEEVAW